MAYLLNLGPDSKGPRNIGGHPSSLICIKPSIQAGPQVTQPLNLCISCNVLLINLNTITAGTDDQRIVNVLFVQVVIEKYLCYSILFYSILFYSILFYSILFYYILFYSVLFYSIILYYILFYSILFYSIIFYYIIFYYILFYSVPFHSILFYSILAEQSRLFTRKMRSLCDRKHNCCP